MPDGKLPPPLPPRPFTPNPFRDVREEEQLRSADTPPERPVPQPTLREVVDALNAHRRDLVALSGRLDAQQPPAGPSVVSIPPDSPPKSKAMVVASAAGALGKWTTIVMGVLGLAATVAHQFRPDLEGPIQFFIKLLGGTP